MAIRIGVKPTLAFDPGPTLQALDRAKTAQFRRAGSFVARKAKDLIRTRKTSSRPGDPPHSHVGTLRRKISFAADSTDAVIGPTPLGHIGKIPPILEYGGRTYIRNRLRTTYRIGRIGPIELDADPAKPFVTEDPTTGRYIARTRLRTPEMVKRATEIDRELNGELHLAAFEIEPRPYMRPALEREAPKFPDLFRDSIQ